MGAYWSTTCYGPYHNIWAPTILDSVDKTLKKMFLYIRAYDCMSLNSSSVDIVYELLLFPSFLFCAHLHLSLFFCCFMYTSHILYVCCYLTSLNKAYIWKHGSLWVTEATVWPSFWQTPGIHVLHGFPLYLNIYHVTLHFDCSSHCGGNAWLATASPGKSAVCLEPDPPNCSGGSKRRGIVINTVYESI